MSDCNPMECSTPGFPVHHQLPKLAQTHVHRVGDAIQPSHPLLSPSPPAFSLSQHQGLFQYIYTHRYTQHSTHVHTHNLYSVLSLYNYQRVKTTFFPWWVSWSIKWLKSQMKGAAKCKLPQTGLYVKSVQSVCITHSRVGVGLRGSHFWLMQFCRVDGMLSYTEGLNLNVSCIQ